MPLRKPTCLSPQRLDAARRNSQRSIGPRSEAGKQRLKMNAGQGATNPGTESPAEENAGETSKSPEQSENVIENKGPAEERVAA